MLLCGSAIKITTGKQKNPCSNLSNFISSLLGFLNSFDSLTHASRMSYQTSKSRIACDARAQEQKKVGMEKFLPGFFFLLPLYHTAAVYQAKMLDPNLNGP